MLGWSFYLTDPWKQALWIGLTIFWIGLLLYVRIIKPLFMLRQPYRVSEVRKERGDTWTLVMQPDGHPGFRFGPGQFGWLTVWGTPFKITGHPFSFSSSAAVEDGRVEMTIRNLGDFTGTVHKVPVGQRVYLDGPTAPLPSEPGRYACLGRWWRRHHADGQHHPHARRSRRQAAGGPAVRQQGLGIDTFREELDALKARLDLTVVHVLVDPPMGWTGEHGFIDADVLKRHLLPPYPSRVLHLRAGRDDG